MIQPTPEFTQVELFIWPDTTLPPLKLFIGSSYVFLPNPNHNHNSQSYNDFSGLTQPYHLSNNLGVFLPNPNHNHNSQSYNDFSGLRQPYHLSNNLGVFLPNPNHNHNSQSYNDFSGLTPPYHLSNNLYTGSSSQTPINPNHKADKSRPS